MRGKEQQTNIYCDDVTKADKENKKNQNKKAIQCFSVMGMEKP